ncbi:thiamine pyrophosphate-dependent enzyme [Nitrososphaera sp.]|uniref:thiamine pyrophosphate-dependent enzyme n=1 Tax=Nitrososphaera sp. TaxID=1971748 RepID=UPI00307DD793
MKTADIIAESLLDWGVDTIFGLPGDGINGFIEALRQRSSRIRFVLVRHEESAAFMACAYAKYTGRLGACVATSGPGAIHLLAGLYDAKADGAPVIAITGSTYSDMMGSSYQQDVDLRQLFSDVSVYNNMINSPEHAEMAVDIACRSALAKKGVSHLTIPIDVQEKELHGEYSRHKVPGHTSDAFVTAAMPDPILLRQAADILNAGRKVVVLAGQGALGATDELIAVADRLGAPVVKALLGKAVVPDDHPLCLGGIGLLGTSPSSDAMAEADTLLMVGTSFPYIDYLPRPGQARGVQIDLFAEKIGLRYPVEAGLVGDARLTLSALLPLLQEKSDRRFLKGKQAAMNDWNGLMKERSSRTDIPMKPQVIAAIVSEELEDDAIVSVDSGTNTIWAAQHIYLRRGMKFSLSGTLATMAAGLPYAIAAKIAFPERQSVAFVGDGGFSMLMGEFATAVKYKLPIKVVIVKNNSLGMIRWEQLAFLGNPEYGVEFAPIDFAKFAEACGAAGYSISDPRDARSVVREAMAVDDRPAIIEAVVDPFEPPMPPKVAPSFVSNLAESFAKGQPYASRIGLTIFRDQVHEALRRMHSHHHGGHEEGGAEEKKEEERQAKR